MMKTKTCFLLILILLAVVCAIACAEENTQWYQSGYYRYTLLVDGTAKIDRYCGEETNILIPSELDGIRVTAIGDGAFANFNRFYSSETPEYPVRVIIPEGVTSIGDHAFFGCTRLETVTIPDSLVSIGDLAFDECYSLMEIIIPDGLTHLGANPFFMMSPDHIGISPDHPCFEIRDGMLFSKADGCLICGSYPPESNPAVVIPEGTRLIGDYAFINRSQIVTVAFPDSLNEIGNHAFEYCYRLSSLSLPDSLVSIGDFAFRSCQSLSGQTIVIPESVTHIGDDPFAKSMPDIRFSENHPCLEIVDGMLYSKPDHRLIRRIDRAGENAAVQNGTEAIGGTAFMECVLPESFVIPESVVSIGELAFGDHDPEMMNYISYPAATELKLPASLKRIGAYAFRTYPFLRPEWLQPDPEASALILPESLEEIGESAFSWSTLTHVTVPGGVKAIPRNAFRQCTKLTDAVLSEGITYIDEYAFCGSSLSSIVLPGSLRFIGNNAFADCALTEITLPEGLAYIGSRAFARCPLESLTIPDSVTAFSPLAFVRCTAEIHVSPEHPRLAVVNGALMDKQTGYVFHVHVGEATEIELSAEAKIIGNYAFAESMNLHGIVIPDGITEIGAYAFWGARRLAAVEIPASVGIIGNHAFEACRLTDVTLTEGLEAIGDFAFFDCIKLTSLYIPDTVTYIGTDAFGRCDDLVLTVSPGSYAEQYCIENGLNYTHP